LRVLITLTGLPVAVARGPGAEILLERRLARRSAWSLLSVASRYCFERQPAM
jgi:hypothetical protein